MPAIDAQPQKTPFLSIIWGYSTHMYGFAPEENYHLHMLIQAKKAGFKPYALVRDSKFAMENDPHFDRDITVLAYKNAFDFIFQIIKFSLKNSVFYVNSYEWQSFLVPFLARRTIFMAHTQPKRNSSRKQKVQNFVYRRFKKIRLNNQAEKQFLLNQGIPEKKLVVLPLVVSQKVFRMLPEKEPRTDLVCFGNVTEKKNLSTILKAFELVKKELPILRWHIVGNIWDKKFAQEIEASPVRKDIILHGFMPNETLVPELNKRLIYLNASTDEGQCVAVYDAALCGCALALPKIMSFEEVFKDKALFHDVYEHDQLAKNIMRYIQEPDLRKKYNPAIVDMINKDYSQDIIEQQLQQLLSTL